MSDDTSSASPAHHPRDEDQPEPHKIFRRIEGLLWGIFLLALFGVTYYAKNLLLPVVLAIIIALTLRPVVRWMWRRGVPPQISGVVIILAIAGGVLGSAYAASGPAGRLVQRAPEIGREVQVEMRDIFDRVSQMREATEQVEEMASGGNGGDNQDEDGDGQTDDEETDKPQEVVVQQKGLVEQMASSLATAGTSVVVALILAMFLLASGDFYYRRIVESVPRFHDKKRALMIVRDVEKQISRYLAAITVINAGLGLCIGVTLWLLGMPNPFVWGLAGFLLNYLPYLGAIAGTAATFMVAVVTFDSMAHALLVPAAYYALTAIEGQFVTPMLVGKHLALNTVSVVLTVMLWVWLWGLAGALLAVPVLVAVKAVADNIDGMRGLGRFLGTDNTEPR